jgi:predicted proteasome-type protease
MSDFHEMYEEMQRQAQMWKAWEQAVEDYFRRMPKPKTQTEMESK